MLPILGGVLIVIGACAPVPTMPAPAPAQRTTPVVIDTQTSTAKPEAVVCDRPYQESSIWNVPIDWTTAEIHPMSDLMMAAFFEDHDWIGSDPSQYAPNIYQVSQTTPLVRVELREYRFRDAINDLAIRYGEPASVVWMPLPSGARPSPGSDGQLAIVNVDTGEEWGLNEGHVDAQGSWTAGGVYRYHTDNSGIPPEGFGQRGAGIGQLAGIVRRCEVDQGRIAHAVTLAYDFPCAPEVCQANGWPEVIPPFRKTDGKGTSTHDVPEGARIAVRPEVTREEIAEACRQITGCVLWIRTMQEFGGFVVDNSGHPKTYAEGDATAGWDRDIWSKDMLRHIPQDWYVVLDWNSTGGGVP